MFYMYRLTPEILRFHPIPRFYVFYSLFKKRITQFNNESPVDISWLDDDKYWWKMFYKLQVRL